MSVDSKGKLLYINKRNCQKEKQSVYYELLSHNVKAPTGYQGIIQSKHLNDIMSSSQIVGNHDLNPEIRLIPCIRSLVLKHVCLCILIIFC